MLFYFMVIGGQIYSWWVLPILAWILAWELIAAWTAARKGHKIWFVAIFFFSAYTLSVVPVLYMLMVRREECLKAKVSKKPVKKKSSVKKKTSQKKSSVVKKKSKK